MINGSEPIVAPRDLTKNQLIQKINQVYGGWPVNAAHICQFESKDPKETVYRFVDDRGIAIEANKFRHLTAPLWEIRVTRDDYMLYHLSREAKQILVREAQKALIAKIKVL